jgi:hypothetical protein
MTTLVPAATTLARIRLPLLLVSFLLFGVR